MSYCNYTVCLTLNWCWHKEGTYSIWLNLPNDCNLIRYAWMISFQVYNCLMWQSVILWSKRCSVIETYLWPNSSQQSQWKTLEDYQAPSSDKSLAKRTRSKTHHTMCGDCDGYSIYLFECLCGLCVNVSAAEWKAAWPVTLAIAGNVSGCHCQLWSGWNNHVKGQWQIHFFQSVWKSKESLPAHSGSDVHCTFRKERGSVGFCYWQQGENNIMFPTLKVFEM